MTHRDIIDKFKIEYDKANITSSYPSLTDYEIAVILDKAYLSLIAQKFTGNNMRRVGFETDLKAIEDLAPLVKTVTREGADQINASQIIGVSNALGCVIPEDWLYYVSSVLSFVKTDNGKSHIKNFPTKVIDHSIANRFFTTAYNMPWIKTPVCYSLDGDLIFLFDKFFVNLFFSKSENATNVPTQLIADHSKIALTYIKTPAKFLVTIEDLDQNEDPNEEPEEPAEEPQETIWSIGDILYTEERTNRYKFYTADIGGGINYATNNVDASIEPVDVTITSIEGGAYNYHGYDNDGSVAVTITNNDNTDNVVNITIRATVNVGLSVLSKKLTFSVLYTPPQPQKVDSGLHFLTPVINIADGSTQCSVELSNPNNISRDFIHRGISSTPSGILTLDGESGTNPIIWNFKINGNGTALVGYSYLESDMYYASRGTCTININNLIPETWQINMLSAPYNVYEPSNTLQYSATATSSLGGTSTITFSIVGGSLYASITKNGLLTIKSTCLEQLTITIKVQCDADASCFLSFQQSIKYYRAASGLSWSSDAATVIDRNSYALPILYNPNNIVVTYKSSNPQVATINSNGAVTIIGDGTTVISATNESNYLYQKDTVTYTLTVSIVEQQEVKFNITPLLLDGDHNFHNSFGSTWALTEYHNILLLTDVNNVGNISVYYDGKPLDIYNGLRRIEDFAMILTRGDGIGNSTAYGSHSIVIQSDQYPDKSITVNAGSSVDEALSVTVYYCTTKTIVIPYAGGQTNALQPVLVKSYVQEYPYNFQSILYDGDPCVYLYDKETNTSIELEQSIAENNTTIKGVVFENDTYEGEVESNVRYDMTTTIDPNTTNNYKVFSMFVDGSGKDNDRGRVNFSYSALVNYVQEYYSPYRVYYSDSLYGGDNTAYDTIDGQSNWPASMNSKIARNTTITARRFAYPSSMESLIQLPGTPPSETRTLMWGTQEYKVLRWSNAVNITIN